MYVVVVTTLVEVNGSEPEPDVSIVGPFTSLVKAEEFASLQIEIVDIVGTSVFPLTPPN